MIIADTALCNTVKWAHARAISSDRCLVSSLQMCQLCEHAYIYMCLHCYSFPTCAGTKDTI